jgi:thymidylate kinase
MIRALTYLIILRGPKGSGKTEVPQKLKERFNAKHKERIYLLKFAINTERFEKILDVALDKSYKYVIAELNYGESHSIDSMNNWLERFKHKHHQIVSVVLGASKVIRLQRCKNDPKRNPFDIIDEHFFNHDSEIFERLERDGVFQKKFGIPEITLNTENKSLSQVTDEILNIIFNNETKKIKQF